MKKIILVIAIMATMLAIGCNQKKESLSKGETIALSTDNEAIVKKYISNFLTEGYSKHYTINSINYNIDKNKTMGTDIKIEVYTLVNMNTTNINKEQSEVNFDFKLTADLLDKKIAENSIKLFNAKDVAQGVEYYPAENLLPK